MIFRWQQVSISNVASAYGKLNWGVMLCNTLSLNL